VVVNCPSNQKSLELRESENKVKVAKVKRRARKEANRK
jgi:hypothetical protein